MANRNPYLGLTRARNAVIIELRELFSPANNAAVVPPFEYNYVESSASATLGFYGNPVNNDTITIGTNVITFVVGVPAGLQVHIGATQQLTLASLVALINANSSTLLVSATTNSIPNQLTLTATVSGSAANATTLSASSKVLRFSAGRLSQGGLWDHDNSDIFIGDAVPQDYQDWPMIIVNTASAGETRYLGPEDSYQAKNFNNVVTVDEIFSSLVVTVDIKVYTIDDTLARDKIVDLIYNNLSEIRTQLAVMGMEMIDRTMPPETRLVQNQRVYLENHFILRLYCEWSDNLPITNVSSVSVAVPVDSSAPPVVSSPLSASYDSTLYRQFVVDAVVDATHLAVENASGLSNGDTIVQGSNTTTIIDVVDNNHLQVGSTTGWVIGYANDTSAPLPFNYVITATNSPTSYSATGLPTGLTVNASNGLISGIPTPSGTYYVKITASNSAGSGTQSLTLTVS
jgi:hypothetical protein